MSLKTDGVSHDTWETLNITMLIMYCTKIREQAMKNSSVGDFLTCIYYKKLIEPTMELKDMRSRLDFDTIEYAIEAVKGSI